MAESIKFTDKYIDTTGVYDSTLNKTQQVINSKLVTVDTSSSSIGTPNPVNADTLGGYSMDNFAKTVTLTNNLGGLLGIPVSDNSTTMKRLTNPNLDNANFGGINYVIATTNANAQSNHFPLHYSTTYFTKGILIAIQPNNYSEYTATQPNDVVTQIQIFIALSDDTTSSILGSGALQIYKRCYEGGIPDWGTWEPFGLNWGEFSYGNITLSANETKDYNIHSFISSNNPTKVLAIMPYFSQNKFSSSIYLSGGSWYVVVHNFYTSSLTSSMTIRYIYI